MSLTPHKKRERLKSRSLSIESCTAGTIILRNSIDRFLISNLSSLLPYADHLLSSIKKEDAKEIMKVKRNWPLAMQGKDSALFEEILASNFSFRASYEFYPDKNRILNHI